MALGDEESAAFGALMALTSEECLQLGTIKDPLYIAQALCKLGESLMDTAGAMVDYAANEQGKDPSEICPCQECRELRNENAPKNN